MLSVHHLRNRTAVKHASGMTVGPRPRLNNAAPSLQPHYRAFGATTGCSVPATAHRYSRPRGFGRLRLLPSRQPSKPPAWTQCRFSRSVRKPGRESRRLHAGCRSVRIRTSPELISQEGSPRDFDTVLQLSTLLQWFACARLSRPCLPGSLPRRFRDAHDHGF